MRVGEKLANGRYVLERLLKRTGMAEIWIAKQQGSGGFEKPVVLKMIHPDLNEQTEARERFFDEARLASRIQHPHVVQIYDFGEDNGILYLAMEFIEGYDLETLIKTVRDKGEEIPSPLLCRMIADACQGLAFIHEVKDGNGEPLELVHRDISPQNLVISHSGVIKIIDFGVVQAKQKSSRTQTGVIVGKLQYMSPEQLSSEDLDRRSDVYALGLVLFELLTLKSRFRGKSLLEIFYEALNEPTPEISQFRSDCPEDLIFCVNKALTQDKEKRFQDAYEMQGVLESQLMKLGLHVDHRKVAAYLGQLFSDEEKQDVTSLVDASNYMNALHETEGEQNAFKAESAVHRPDATEFSVASLPIEQFLPTSEFDSAPAKRKREEPLHTMGGYVPPPSISEKLKRSAERLEGHHTMIPANLSKKSPTHQVPDMTAIVASAALKYQDVKDETIVFAHVKPGAYSDPVFEGLEQNDTAIYSKEQAQATAKAAREALLQRKAAEKDTSLSIQGSYNSLYGSVEDPFDQTISSKPINAQISGKFEQRGVALDSDFEKIARKEKPVVHEGKIEEERSAPPTLVFVLIGVVAFLLGLIVILLFLN